MLNKEKRKMLYYFDETADVGFVDRTSSLDEYGIIAGWAFPERCKSKYEMRIEEVLSRLRGLGYKKLHCTEVFRNDENEDIKQELYRILTEFEEYVIIHEGAYPVGVKEFEASVNNHQPASHATVPDHIKIIKRQQRTRLYSTLLEGVIVKLEECATLENEPEVHMFSDRLDTSIQEESADLLEWLGLTKSTVTTKAYDTLNGHRVDRTYTIEMKSDFKFEIERVKSISNVSDVNALSFVADFICFELLRHFRRKMKLQKPIKFQSPETLEGFKLKHRVAFLGDNYFTDLVYAPESA